MRRVGEAAGKLENGAGGHQTESFIQGRGIFSPPRWGETAFSIFPPGSGKWGENKVFSPQGPKYGGKKPPKKIGACGGLIKKPGFAGFCSCFF